MFYPIFHMFDLDDTTLKSNQDWSVKTLIPENLCNLDLIRQIATQKSDQIWYVPGVLYTGRDKVQMTQIRNLFLSQGIKFIAIICRQWDIPQPFNERRFYLKYWNDKILYALYAVENHSAIGKIQIWDDDPVICTMARQMKFNCYQFHECKLIQKDLF